MADAHKEQQSFYLREGTIAALRSISEATGRSMSAVADEFLEAQIRQFRLDRRVSQHVQVLQENLPKSLRDVSDDHPIFGGKIPKMVDSVLKTPLEAVYN